MSHQNVFEITRDEIGLVLHILQDIRRTVGEACPEEVSERVAVEVEKMYREANMMLLHKMGDVTYPDERG